MTKENKKKKKKRFFSSSKIIIVSSVVGILLICYLAILFVAVPECSDCFMSLDLTSKYVKKLPEFPKPDNTNLVKPDYTSFYKSNLPNFFDKFKALFGVVAKKFSVASFKKLLDGQIEIREQEGLAGNFIYKYPVKDGMKCIIWGDVQGAFLSLARDLVKLKELDLINDDFTLTREQDFIVFMGDAISRSPYTMETLGLILKLMSANPGKVFYLRGSHESNKYWEQHSLKIELDTRAQKYPSLDDDINKFFNTLPLALYLQENKQLVRISPWSADDEKHDYVKEVLYADFLLGPAGKIEKFQVKKDGVSDEEINLHVVIKAQKKREKFQQMDGLRFLPPERGAIAWTLLGAPTLSYIKLFKYFHDSFCVIDIGSQINNWIIEKYSRHVIKDKEFYSMKYSFISGKELTDGQVKELKEVTDDEFFSRSSRSFDTQAKLATQDERTVEPEIKEEQAEEGFEQETDLGFEPKVNKKRKKVAIKKQVRIKSKDIKLKLEEGEEELGFVVDIEEFEEEK